MTMPMTYSRFVSGSADYTALAATEEHVRAHLSSVADADDDPTTHADDVTIDRREQDGGVLIVGTLDAEPNAPYLRDDWDPEQDVLDNPLTVPSILDGGP